MTNLKNLLRKALTLVPRTGFKYRKTNGFVTNEFGQRVQSYADWIDRTGMVEPGLVSSFGIKNLSDIEYKALGLDPSKRSITIWIEDRDITGTAGRNSCDQVMYCGRVYNILNVEDWLDYNGWKRCYCQEVIHMEES